MSNNIIWPLATVEPREVQLKALEKGYGKPGFAYFLRQRLGKTWLAYAEFKLLRTEGKVDWFIIICPNSIKEQWEKAVEEVDPYIPIMVYNSQQKAKADYWFTNNKLGGVFIINYESVRAFYEDSAINKFDPTRTYLAADESTKIADNSSKMSKACLDLAAVCAYTRVLTGKPSKGKNTDLWTQLKFIGATERNYTQHKYTFTSTNYFKTTNINTNMLKKEMEPYCYIAEDKYIRGFEKIYEPLRKVELTGEQAKLYKEMEKELITEISEDIKMTAPIVLVKYLRLQQISSGIGGDVDGIQHNLIEPSKNPRIKVLKEIIENEVDHKVIIVCRFRLSMKNLYEELTKEGYKCAMMIGGMGSELEKQKALFHKGDHDICIAQEQVLNFGHTMCGPDDNPCTDMIFYEDSFSLINRAQCESRPEKFERNKPISYWGMYASEMNKMMIKALIKKEDASLALMNYARDMGIMSGNLF